MDLEGKVMLITGGASGIGAATAELFAAQGARIVLVDVDLRAGQEMLDRLGPPHGFVPFDVSDRQAWMSNLQSVVDRFGHLDLVHLNAGAMTRPRGALLADDPLGWITPENYTRSIGVNLSGVLWGITTSIPYLSRRPGATVLVTSSGAGFLGYPADPLYSMAKAGALALVASLTPTLAEQGIRIVTLSPGVIDTPMCPPDLRAQREREGMLCSASVMAESILHIYEVARTGEIWSGGDETVRLERTAPAVAVLGPDRVS